MSFKMIAMKNIFIAFVFSIVLSSCSKTNQDPTFTTVNGILIHLSTVTALGLGENAGKTVCYTVYFKDNTFLNVFVDATYSESVIKSDYNKLNSILHP